MKLLFVFFIFIVSCSSKHPVQEHELMDYLNEVVNHTKNKSAIGLSSKLEFPLEVWNADLSGNTRIHKHPTKDQYLSEVEAGFSIIENYTFSSNFMQIRQFDKTHFLIHEVYESGDFPKVSFKSKTKQIYHVKRISGKLKAIKINNSLLSYQTFPK